MLVSQFSQAFPGPSMLYTIQSNLYASFMEEFSTKSWFNSEPAETIAEKAAPSEEEITYLLSLAENYGICFL